MLNKTRTLNSSHKMPMIGFGTWLIPKEDINKSIRSAIKAGYKHIDTAHIYTTESVLGKTLTKIFEEGLIKREDLFITSKLWNSYHNNVELGVRNTLKDLQLEYLDLYIVHWPVTFKDKDCVGQKDKNGNYIIEEYDVLKVWKQMEELVRKGLVRSIGVANHGIKNLDLILNSCTIKPAVNQFEISPYLTQVPLVDYCRKHDIQVISYSSLGSSSKSKYNVREDSCIKELASKYKKTIPQIILSSLVSKDIMVIPRSTNDEHIKENIDLVQLSDEDCHKVMSLNKNNRVVDIPEWGEHRFD